jgi:hypothetical protein
MYKVEIEKILIFRVDLLLVTVNLVAQFFSMSNHIQNKTSFNILKNYWKLMNIDNV